MGDSETILGDRTWQRQQTNPGLGYIQEVRLEKAVRSFVLLKFTNPLIELHEYVSTVYVGIVRGISLNGNRSSSSSSSSISSISSSSSSSSSSSNSSKASDHSAYIRVKARLCKAVPS
ncbi:hypothetical protein M0802_006493 [Mischocyttarus mexicanus]|nr:hypothetical protein M0802_006493 [Mischocyttarus mexicanus]